MTPLLELAADLRDSLKPLSFGPPVWTHYNALEYAWEGHASFLERYAPGRPEFLFMGMNPGPWGMAQTGVPFGEIAAVRDWMGIEAPIGKPAREHPKRPVEGFACTRSEVSGRRLWGLIAERFPDPKDFFRRAFVINYCPLSFISESGANITPDKLPVDERKPLEAICDAHLRAVVHCLEPSKLVGIGGFATKCFQRAIEGPIEVHTLLHPSPASPIANREWPARPLRELQALGLVREPGSLES
jgi:single-strand selective monofunctional uracil DNA glycosylase